MKRQLVKLALICSVFFVSSCHKSDDNMDGNNTGDVTSGTWHVTLFTDSGNDETSDFSGYNFSFNSNGSLSVSKSSSSATGTWSKSSSKFNIDLGPKSDANKPLGELTDDWQIISISSTQIKLGDDNSASGESLTFTKN
jgi:hypothetical protein